MNSTQLGTCTWLCGLVTGVTMGSIQTSSLGMPNSAAFCINSAASTPLSLASLGRPDGPQSRATTPALYLLAMGNFPSMLSGLAMMELMTALPFLF